MTDTADNTQVRVAKITAFQAIIVALIMVVVLGHPEYYPRFGFVPASRFGVRCQWEGVPDEAFMMCVLDEGATTGTGGLARYRSEFDAAV